MLRVMGELCTDDSSGEVAFSLPLPAGGGNAAGIVEAEVLSGGVPGDSNLTAVEGRDRVTEGDDSRSRTRLAIDMMFPAMVSKSFVILVMALLTLQLLRPPRAMRAYVRM
jgi:hypothetical protein